MSVNKWYDRKTRCFHNECRQLSPAQKQAFGNQASSFPSVTPATGNRRVTRFKSQEFHEFNQRTLYSGITILGISSKAFLKSFQVFQTGSNDNWPAMISFKLAKSTVTEGNHNMGLHSRLVETWECFLDWQLLPTCQIRFCMISPSLVLPHSWHYVCQRMFDSQEESVPNIVSAPHLQLRQLLAAEH